MKVNQSKEDDPHDPKSWRGLRIGVADLHRSAQISQKSNERYIDVLASVDTDLFLAEISADMCQRASWNDHSVCVLNSLAREDTRLMEAASHGGITIYGFRNRDLRAAVFDNDTSAGSPRQKMANVTRLTLLFRAHRLFHKVAETHRYILSKHGRNTVTTLLAVRHANIRNLTEPAV